MIEGTVSKPGRARAASGPLRRTEVLLLPGQPPRVAPSPQAEAQRSATARTSLRLISCIMASRGRPFPARLAIDCFRRQTYPSKELVIATAATDGALGAYVRQLGDPAVRLIEVAGPDSPGRLRNAAIAQSNGAYIAVWDDDDLSCPDRLAIQEQAICDADVAACFLSRVLLWWPQHRRLAASSPRIWENTMIVRRAELPPYREDSLPGEDTDVAAALRAAQPLLLADQPEAYCYVAHGSNLCSADHFAMLFDRASRPFAALEYDAAIRELDRTMPVLAYAAGLSAQR